MVNQANTNPSNQKSGPNKIVLILCLIAALLIVFYVMRGDKTAPSTTRTNEVASATSSNEKNFVKPEAAETNAAPETPEEPAENAQRSYLVHDFRNQKEFPAGWHTTNLVLTENGFTLAPGATNGTLETATLPLNLPSNMVAPLVKKEGPECSGFKLEMAITSDNQTWSPWYPCEPTGDDINPIYPDGTPNPNYGHEGYTYVSTGLDLSAFTKYRIVLEKGANCPQAPTVQGMRLYHLDSTLGDGKMATSYPPGPMSPEEFKKWAEEEEKKNKQQALNNGAAPQDTQPQPPN